MTKVLLAGLISFVGMAYLGWTQESAPRMKPTDPPKTETGRFGNPTSTARAYQNFKLGIVKEISQNELVLDKTSYGDGQAFKLTANTKFIHDSEKASLSQLKVGDQVFFSVKTNKKTGEMNLDIVAWGVVGKKMKGQGINR